MDNFRTYFFFFFVDFEDLVFGWALVVDSLERELLILAALFL